MKTEIIEIEVPKKFKPFKLEITVESEDDLRDLIGGLGKMRASNTRQIYDKLIDIEITLK
jgi:hypothetical protein